MSSKETARNAQVLPQVEESWTEERLRIALPLPSADANKYTRGVLTVIAGSKRYPGAACLAARAGMRMGAGYVKVVTDKAAVSLLLGAAPSLVVRTVKDWRPSELATIKKNSPQAVCIGPGFVPNDPRTAELVIGTLKQANCPVLVDGGGLSALGSKKALKALKNRKSRGLATVITPHGGEAARLQAALGIDADMDAPEQLAATLANATGAIVVLKGPDTYVSDGKRVVPMREGTPALAKAGTGDVLAGMISSLLAQGVNPLDAGVLGAMLHARAGVIAAQTYTVVGVTPEDAIEAIPAAICSLAKLEMA